MPRILLCVAVVALSVPCHVVQALDVVEALWNFDEWAGQTIPDGGVVLDTSGQGRHLINHRANTTTVAPASALTPGGTTAIQMSGIDGGASISGTDFLEFIAANEPGSPWVFPAGIHWMVEMVVSDHDPTNFGEAGLFSTGDYNDLGGIDKFSIDVTPTQYDLNHDDANDSGVANGETPEVRESGITPADPRFEHIAFVRDRQNDRLEFYRDGVLTDFEAGIGGGNNIENTSGNIYIGAQIIANLGAAANARLFRGEIDAIKITTRDTFGAGSQFGPADFGNFIPEPSTLVMVVIGMLGMLARRRR